MVKKLVIVALIYLKLSRKTYNMTLPPPPPYLHPIHVYQHDAYLAGTSAPESMRIDFRLYRIVVYTGGISAWLASSYNIGNIICIHKQIKRAVNHVGPYLAINNSA